MVTLVFVFAIVSFLRENWAANETPGVLETFLAKLVLRQARSQQANLPNPFPPTEQNLQEGREHYEKQCAFCHGLDGEGQDQSGLQFYPPVPSLVDIEGEMTDAQIHFLITRGIRYTAMPSFAKVFSPEETWKIVLWAKHLSRLTSQKKPVILPEEKEHYK